MVVKQPSTDKKREVAYSTFLKWRTDLDQECQTISWLECDTEPGRKRAVTKLRCDVRVKFRTSISYRRNFSHKWILGAESIRSSNIRDHAKADQHVTAMNLLKRERARLTGSDPSSCAPIVRALHQLQESDKVQLHH